MAKKYFCANCGKQLGVKLQAVPSMETIVRLVEFHECSKNDDFKLPEEFSDRPFVVKQGKNEFVEKINNLPPAPIADLRDRRPTDQVKDSIAPPGVKALFPTMPLPNTDKKPDIIDSPDPMDIFEGDPEESSD